MKTKRQILDSILRKEYKKNSKLIYNLLDKYEYISFDVFDTLIKRVTADPADVFEIVERKFNQREKIYGQIVDFKKKRQNAQACAKKKANTEDITINEIYRELSDLSEQQKKKLMLLEEETEINSAVFNLEIEDIWRYCIQKKKKIICISDMYLSKDIIQRILKKCSITQYESIYVSSDIKLKKSTGHLYEYVLNDLGITASSVLHIGDNWKSDFISAYRAKIRAILWPRELKNIYYWEQGKQQNLDQKILYTTANLNVQKLNNECERLGYEVLGILLLGFCKWMKERSQGDEKLFFLARDSYIIQKAFELIYPEEKEKSTYLYLSRKSVIRPYLFGCTQIEEIWKLYAEKEDKVTYKAVWDDLGLKGIERYRGFSWDKKIRKKEFLKGDFKTIIEESLDKDQELIRKDQELFLKYFNQEDVRDSVGFVDLGWKGTIPFCVEKIYEKCNINLNLQNYMFGYIKNENRILKNAVNSFLYEEQSMEDLTAKMQMSLFELFFLEPSGSTVGYQEEAGKIVPSKGKNENNDSIQNIMSIQKGALIFIEDIIKYLNIDKIEIDRTTAITPFLKFSEEPRLKDIKCFQRIQYFSMKSFGLLSKNKRSWYFLHPNEFLKEFSNSVWKVGFLKEFFRIPFPYNSFYKFLKILKNKKSNRY